MVANRVGVNSPLRHPQFRKAHTTGNLALGRALDAFVKYANLTGAEATTDIQAPLGLPNTGRDPSLRLRWRVLQRDRFTCCACGASPALTLGTELHVDHVVPWSKGGKTLLENLQTLCSTCNLGKSNIYEG